MSAITKSTRITNGCAPRQLDAKHKRLLAKQASLLKVIREQGTGGAPPPQSIIKKRTIQPLSKAAAIEIAKQVGILTPAGRLSASYKK